MAHVQELPAGDMRSRADDADELYEVIDGQRQERSPMGAYEAWLASRLIRYLAPFCDEKSLGHAVTEMFFVLRAEPTSLELRPDVAFVSYARWPADREIPRTRAWDVVPNLAIEVISKSNLADEIPTRVGKYFQAGVQQVWIVFGVASLVHIYDSPTQVRILEHQDQVEGGTMLPGFRLPLAQLFGKLPTV